MQLIKYNRITDTNDLQNRINTAKCYTYLKKFGRLSE